MDDLPPPPPPRPSLCISSVYHYDIDLSHPQSTPPPPADRWTPEEDDLDIVHVHGTVDLDGFIQAYAARPPLPPPSVVPPPLPKPALSLISLRHVPSVPIPPPKRNLSLSRSSHHLAPPELTPPRPHPLSYRSTSSRSLSPFSRSSTSSSPPVPIHLFTQSPPPSAVFIDSEEWHGVQPIQLEFRRVSVTLPILSPSLSLSQHMEKLTNSFASLPRLLFPRSAALPSPRFPEVELAASTVPFHSSNLHFDPRTASSSSSVRRVLSEVSGFACPGQLLAIMGSSGSGKTTLLNVLAGRLKGGRGKSRVEGELFLNNKAASGSVLSCISAYVMQNDVLMPVCTAREHLQFSADMRLPPASDGHAAKVAEVLEELGLTHCADVRVGIPAAGTAAATGGGEQRTGDSLFDKAVRFLQPSHRGLSGGEQKRVSIGIELVTDPLLLFIDEPTSGLDSSTAFTIVSLLKRLARRGRTVICTIHCPSSKIFALFDQLLLLTPMGEVAYLGQASLSLSHFERLGQYCPPRMNAADFFLRLLHVGGEEDRERVQLLASAYAECPAEPPVGEGKEVSGRSKSSTTQPFLHQLLLLTKRAWWQYVRQPLHIAARVGENLLLTLFVGLLFLQTGTDQRSIYARIAFIFFLVCLCSLTTLVYSVLTCQKSLTYPFAFASLPCAAVFALDGLDLGSSEMLSHTSLPLSPSFSLLCPPLSFFAVISVTEERLLFTRERGQHHYRVTSYFLSKTLIEVPVQILLSFLLGAIGYFMVGLQPSASHFFRFSLGLALLSLASNSLGQILGALAPSALFAVMLSPLCVIPFMLTSGFFLNYDDIPPYLLPLRVLSPHLYVFTSLFSEEFTELKFHCLVDETIPIYVGNLKVDYCYLVRGEQVLDMFHIGRNGAETFWLSMFYVLMLFVGFRMVALGALKLKGLQDGLLICSFLCLILLLFVVFPVFLLAPLILLPLLTSLRCGDARCLLARAAVLRWRSGSGGVGLCRG